MTEHKIGKLDCTLTTAFLLPGIGHKRQELLPYGFIDAYLDDPKHEINYERSIYLLFKPKDQDIMNKLLKTEEKNPLFIEDYDYPGGYTVLVYKFDEKYTKEYELFKKGSYSKFGKEYISLVPRYVDLLNEQTGNMEARTSLPYHILNRTEAIVAWRKRWLKDIGVEMEEKEIEEVWSAPTIEQEILLMDKIYKEHGK